MKKALVLLSVVVFLGLTACSSGEEINLPTKGIYYISNDDQSIDFEEYDIEEQDPELAAGQVIESMKKQPELRGYKSVFRPGVEISDLELSSDRITLTMEGGYLLLEPTVEVLTRGALVRSLCSVDGISFVEMKVGAEPLKDTYGNPVGIMEAEAFIDNSGREINVYKKTSVSLFFADATGRKLEQVIRTLTYNTNISIERLVMEQLIRGPYTNEVYPTINPETKLLDITVRDGICYVNLDQTFLNQTVNATPEATIYSITNSLVELPNINKVQISINGSTDDMYREKLSLSTVYERNLEIVMP